MPLLTLGHPQHHRYSSQTDGATSAPSYHGDRHSTGSFLSMAGYSATKPPSVSITFAWCTPSKVQRYSALLLLQKRDHPLFANKVALDIITVGPSKVQLARPYLRFESRFSMSLHRAGLSGWISHKFPHRTPLMHCTCKKMVVFGESFDKDAPTFSFGASLEDPPINTLMDFGGC